MTANIQQIEDGLNNLRGKEFISDSTIDFFRDIFRAQYRIKDKMGKTASACSLTENEMQEKLRKGNPLITWDNISLDKSLLQDLFQEICIIVKNQENVKKDTVERLIEAETSVRLQLDTLIEKLFSHDNDFFVNLSEQIEVEQDLLIFCSIQLAKPFFESMAETLRVKVEGNKWLRHYCPVCGSSALISRLEKEAGKRILYCTLCDSQWRTMRLKCAFCGNDQASGLKFLAEEEGPYRIDFCEECGRYLKTFDERKAGSTPKEIIAAVEDIATMYLDILAEKRGFKRSWFFPPKAEKLKGSGKSKGVH